MSDGKKLILTDEMRKELFGLAPFSPEQKFEWSPKKFAVTSLPAEFVPVYILSCFTLEEKEAVDLQLKEATKMSLDDIRAIIRPKIHDMKNVIDIGSSSILPFVGGPEQGISKELLLTFSKLLVEEIFYYLIHASGIMDTEKLGLR